MTTLAEAETPLFDLAEQLTERLQAKGYAKCWAEVWIAWRKERNIVIYIENAPKSMGLISGRTIEGAASYAHAEIDKLPDLTAENRALAAWFDVPACEAEAA